MEPGVDHRAAERFLVSCDDAYSFLLARLGRHSDDDRRLGWIELVADFAWNHHPGFYADGRLETAIGEIGRRLPATPPGPIADTELLFADSDARRRVLHVASELPGVGGHVRLLLSWIEKDVGSAHAVMLTRQAVESCPTPVARRFRDRGVATASVAAIRGITGRAAALRAVIEAAGPDVIVLHHHPNDACAVAALARDGGPPVVLMNHADHCFWIGSSVADLVLNFRGFGSGLCQTRRHARAVATLPLPVTRPRAPLDRTAARERLGMAGDEVVLLSIGNSSKFVPAGRHDFFRTAARVLDRHPAARIDLVGPSERRIPPHGRRPGVHAHGLLPDPATHQVAADVYLEGFPYGGFTALLESALLGLPPVLMYAPDPQLAVSEDPAFEGLVDNPPSEAAWLERVARLIEDRNARRELGARVSEAVDRFHCRGWAARLERVYSPLAGSTHRVHDVPAGCCQGTRDDLVRAEYCMAQHLHHDAPMLARVKRRSLRLPDALALAAASVRRRDTRPTPRHLLKWAGRFAGSLRSHRG